MSFFFYFVKIHCVNKAVFVGPSLSKPVFNTLVCPLEWMLKYQSNLVCCFGFDSIKKVYLPKYLYIYIKELYRRKKLTLKLKVM